MKPASFSALSSLATMGSSTFYSVPHAHGTTKHQPPNFYKDPPAIDLPEWNLRMDMLTHDLAGRVPKKGTTRRLLDLTKQLSNLHEADRHSCIGQLLWAMKLKNSDSLNQLLCVSHYIRRLPQHEQELHAANLKNLARQVFKVRRDPAHERAAAMKEFGLEENDLVRRVKRPHVKTALQASLSNFPASVRNSIAPMPMPMPISVTAADKHAMALDKWEKDFDWYVSETIDPFESRSDCLASLIRDLEPLSTDDRRLCTQRLNGESKQQGAEALPLRPPIKLP